VIITNILLNTNYIASITYNAGQIVMRLNGVQVQTGTLASSTGSNANNRLKIGFDIDPSSMQGRVRDIVILPYAASLRQLQLWEGFLSWKTITNRWALNSTHPFANRPPYTGDL
jgi:hypothetical protein